MSACDRARQLGLTGTVSNLPDGRVEVLACGGQAALDALQDWLQQGPPQASVSEVQVESVAGPAPESFEIS